MTPEQFERWKDFAVRMARHGWPNATPARRQRLEREVLGFLDCCSLSMESIFDWDHGVDGDMGIGDWVTEYFYRHARYRTTRQGDAIEHRNRFYAMIRSCLRAGLDVASAPSAGVIGFTVADLKRMYDGTIPDWITSQYKQDLNAQADTMGVWL